MSDPRTRFEPHYLPKPTFKCHAELVIMLQSVYEEWVTKLYPHLRGKNVVPRNLG